MKILRIVVLLSCLGISYTVAQRRQQNAAEAQPDTQPSIAAPTRVRGRARFVKTPEFEKVSSDYAAASRSSASDGRSEGKSRSLGAGINSRRNSISSTSTKPSSTRRLYEVQEIVDDIPDRSSGYHRPRVITEDKFEIPNAPKSTLFETSTGQTVPKEQLPVDELIRTFGTLRSDQPTKLELPQILPLDENSSEQSLSSSTPKKSDSDEVLSSTTEKEMERELMKKDQSTKGPENSTSDVSSTTPAQVKRTVIRSRANAQKQSTESTSNAPVRSRSRSKSVQSNKVENTEQSTRRASVTEKSDENTTRGSFRVGRRRITTPLKDRGPAVTEDDSQLPKTRTSRDSNLSSYPTARRGAIRNATPRSSPDAVEPATIRNRADVRRSRGRKIDTPQAPGTISQDIKPTTDFSSRRSRTRVQGNIQPVQDSVPTIRATARADVSAAPRTFQEPIKPRTQTVENVAPAAPARDTRGRTRSRFQVSDIENVKFEPQQSVEHSTRALPRRPARTRPPIAHAEELIASSTVENPIRVALPPTSTIRSVNAIPMRVKESVHSEISEVVSSRKVARRKKPDAKPANQKSQEEEDIGELNYPPQFKAIILANKSKDERKPDSESLSPSFNDSSSSLTGSITSSTETTATSTTGTTLLSTTAWLVSSSTLFPPKHVEEVDNDLARTLRPTRRRFSVSTRKPNTDTDTTTTHKPNVFPTRKIIANPDPEKIAKFHARFNNQFQRNHTRSNDEAISSTTTTTTKRTTKPPSKVLYTRKPDKVLERKFNQPPTKSNRYSSRYRSEARSSVPTRAATTPPLYVPTVPTVTPAGTAFSTHQAPKRNDEHAINDEIDDIKIISIAQPIANSLYSDNLVTENNPTVNSSAATNEPTGSIIERIINSISSISTTSKPETKVLPTGSAILKIPPPPKKREDETVRNQIPLTTEKPTTIIERILNSLSAIQTSDNNVGNVDATNKTRNELDSILEESDSRKESTLVKGTQKTSVASSTPPTFTTSTTSAPTTTMKVALAPTNKPMQSTVAISLADYIASLGIGKTQKPPASNGAVTTTTTLPSTTVVDENKNTIEYRETTTVSDKTTTTEPTTETTTNIMKKENDITTSTLKTTTGVTTEEPTTTDNWLNKILRYDTNADVYTSTQRIDATTLGSGESTTFGTTSITELMDKSTKIASTTMLTTTKIQITTPMVNVSPNSVTITSSSDMNNNSTDSLPTTNSNNRTGKLLEKLVEEINNEITSSKHNNNATNVTTNDASNSTMSPEDYFIFAVLPNNTIVRKRPRKISAPYFIYGVYPNNTIIRKFPNGTLVPDDPVVQDLMEVNQLSLDLDNDTTVLTKKTLQEYTNLLNRTITTAPSTTTDSAMSTTPVSATTVMSTSINPTEDNINTDTISTEMSIDVTTLNEPMVIELGPTTESDLIEEIPGADVNSIDTTRKFDNILSTISATTPDPPITTTDLGINESSFESELNEELEDTTLPMPDTSTIVMTSTSTPAETTITPEPDGKSATFSSNWTIYPSLHKRIRLRLIRRRRPSRMEYLEIIRNSTPASNDELENEIKNNSGTPRVEEILTSTVRYTQNVASNSDSPSTFTSPITTTIPYSTSVPPTRTTTKRITTRITTTTPKPTTTKTTTRPTTTFRQATTRTYPTTTYIPSTTTDISTFITNVLSTLRPVYIPTTTPPTSTIPTTTETTTPPTVTITARRRTTTTESTTTYRTTNAIRRTSPTTTTTTSTTTTTKPTIITQRPFRENIASTTPTTTFNFDTTTLDPSKVDIDEIVRKSKKKLTPQQLEEIEQLKALEREQANLLQQLSLLTNLNLNGAQKPKKDSSSGNLANRIVQFAKERDQTTEVPIYTEIPVTRIPKKLPVLDSKGTTVEDIIKELNSAQNSVGDNQGSGRSQEAIIAEILKQRGIEPSTPKALSDAFRTTTTRRPRTTTQRPGRIMQGLSWLLNQFGGAEPAPPPPPPPKPRTTRRTTTTPRPEEDELHFQSTELNNVIHNTPSNTFKRPVNSLSDEELRRLINQLEAIQRDPKQAQNLDITPFRKLQAQSTTLNNKNVEIFTTGGGSNQVTRSPKAAESNRVRTVKSTTSNSIEEIDEENEVTTARTRSSSRGRATLPPVELNHVPGIEDNAQGPQIGGNFLNAAVNVTRAISTFLGAAIQGAARSFQSAIGSSSSAAGGLFRASG